MPPAVLVAEDEPTVRTLVESIIAEFGYETFSAANAREALAVLDDGALITLLFTDINMPDGPDGLDGLELARPCGPDRWSGDQRGSRHQAGERYSRHARHRQEGPYRQG